MNLAPTTKPTIVHSHLVPETKKRWRRDCLSSFLQKRKKKEKNERTCDRRLGHECQLVPDSIYLFAFSNIN